MLVSRPRVQSQLPCHFHHWHHYCEGNRRNRLSKTARRLASHSLCNRKTGTDTSRPMPVMFWSAHPTAYTEAEFFTEDMRALPRYGTHDTENTELPHTCSLLKEGNKSFTQTSPKLVSPNTSVTNTSAKYHHLTECTILLKHVNENLHSVCWR